MLLFLGFLSELGLTEDNICTSKRILKIYITYNDLLLIGGNTYKPCDLMIYFYRPLSLSNLTYIEFFTYYACRRKIGQRFKPYKPYDIYCKEAHLNCEEVQSTTPSSGNDAHLTHANPIQDSEGVKCTTLSSGSNGNGSTVSGEKGASTTVSSHSEFEYYITYIPKLATFPVTATTTPSLPALSSSPLTTGTSAAPPHPLMPITTTLPYQYHPYYICRRAKYRDRVATDIEFVENREEEDCQPCPLSGSGYETTDLTHPSSPPRSPRSPTQRELYYLRLILLTRPVRSFEDAKTVVCLNPKNTSFPTIPSTSSVIQVASVESHISLLTTPTTSITFDTFEEAYKYTYNNMK